MARNERDVPPSEPHALALPVEPAASGGSPRRSQHGRAGVFQRFAALVELAPDAIVVAGRDGHIVFVNRQTEVLFDYPREQLLGQPVEQLMPERVHSVHMQHRLDYLAAPHPRVMGADLHLLGRRRDGSEFPIEVSLSPLDADESESESLVIASIRDVGELQRVQAARREEEMANQELRQMQALTDTALSHLDLEDLLDALLDRVHTVMGVDDVAILLLDADGQHLRPRATRGLQELTAVAVKIPVGQGFSGRIAATRAPLVVNDLSAFETYYARMRETQQSAMGVPLLVEGRLLGVVYVGSVAPRRFGQAEVELLQRAADRIALAIDRARAYEAVKVARQEAEAALAQARASENRFQRLVEAGIVGIVVDDTERVIEPNDAFLRMLDYSREELVAGQLTKHDLMTPATVAARERSIQEVLATGASQPIEREYVRKDGTRVPALVGMALLERDPVRFVSFVVDLTERKGLEQKRDEQAEQLSRIFEGITDGLVVYDAAGQVVRTNAAARRILGLDAAPSAYTQMLTRDRAVLYEAHDEQGRLLAPEDWPLIRVLRGQVVTGADARDIRLCSLDGREVDLHTSAAPLRDGAGRLVGVVSILHDQTEQRRLEREREEALRRSEAWFHSMADTAPVLLWVSDTAGLVTFVNLPWLQFTGRRLEQELGNGWAEGVHADDYQRCLDTYRTVFHARERFTMMYRLRRADGVYRWIVDSGVPRFAPDGTFEGYIGSALDVTEREELKQEREEARARELAVREVNQRLDTFVAMAAHDLRHPVMVSKMGVELAQRQVLNAAALFRGATAKQALPFGEVSRALAMTEQSLDRLTRLLQQLLDVARIREGTLVLERRPCLLVNLVRASVDEQRLLTPSRTIVLAVRHPDTLQAVVEVDADRLGQVLTNYLSNAMRYSSEDQAIEVTMRVARKAAEGAAAHATGDMAGEVVRVEVRDHGQGIPPEEQASVWGRFQRARTAGETGGGLGLGLYIARMLVEQHRGDVGVESVVGEGSTFWFELPLAPSEATRVGDGGARQAHERKR